MTTQQSLKGRDVSKISGCIVVGLLILLRLNQRAQRLMVIDAPALARIEVKGGVNGLCSRAGMICTGTTHTIDKE